jgi:pimeloyl-ACP methyl ester carboxylesterase
LVIWGAEDQEYETSKNIAAYEDVSGVVVKAIPGTGHAPFVEVPQEVGQLIIGLVRKINRAAAVKGDGHRDA